MISLGRVTVLPLVSKIPSVNPIVIATLPTAFVFFVMQKQFVQGVLGTVK